jgi:hypothetical protein
MNLGGSQPLVLVQKIHDLPFAPAQILVRVPGHATQLLKN